MDDTNQVRLFVQKNQLLQAKTLCISICTSTPENTEAWYLLGMIHGMEKNFSEANDCYEKVINLEPEMAAAYFNKGIALHGMQQFDDAITAYTRVIELDENFENIYSLLGDTYNASRQQDLAIENYQLALKKNINNTQALFNLASVYHKREEFESAMEYYKKVISIETDHYLAHNNLGLVYKDSEDLDRAVESFINAIRYKYNFSDAYTNLGHAYQLQKKDYESFEAFKKANELKPESAETYYNLATHHEKKGDYKLAIELLSQAISYDSDNPRYCAVLARVYALDENKEQAIHFYKKTLDKDDSIADIHCCLAKIYVDLDDNENAITYLKRTLEINPEHVTACYFLTELAPELVTEKTQSEYVESLFDSYADTFERDLVVALKYNTPANIYEAVTDSLDNNNKSLTVFDLGCGTGLCGLLFKPISTRLVGVDLSPKIIEKAREKEVYDELIVSDIMSSLEDECSNVDLIIAADVFVYMGDLLAVFNACGKSLKPEGLFSFSVEQLDALSFKLQGSGRYAHSVKYITDLASSTGFEIVHHSTGELRKEYKISLQGDIFVLKKVT